MTAERAISCSGERKTGEPDKRFASEVDMRADALSDRDDVNSFRKIPTADAELQTLFGGAVAGGRRAHLVTIEDADTSRRVFEIGKTMIDPEVTVLHTGQVGWPRSIVMRFRLQPIICQRMEGDSLISDTGFRRIPEDSRLRFASRYPACTSSSEVVSDETATCRAKSSRALTEGLSD